MARDFFLANPPPPPEEDFRAALRLAAGVASAWAVNINLLFRTAIIITQQKIVVRSDIIMKVVVDMWRQEATN